ncbi:2-dehydropantoate 2-reductase [Moelleriella libera RCEF 2490]|uniref:2-dehydropantoate 2-reductase n=1 Tax=Moelleriella libera RCEF 2490 TaxID=1081109 RepID=A0A167XV95_9HYPO|nr:2-dehydropantoate 2-reductase [Moelleriella libera RCEF 2490]
MSSRDRTGIPPLLFPSVLLPRGAAHSPSVHKIHILGEDERSKFIAHALSSVYDSVEMLSWRNQPSARYRNIQKRPPSIRGASPEIEPNRVVPRPIAESEDAPIDQLIVTGRGHEAAKALDLVKSRIDERTTICLMNEGLGVLEDVRRKVFAGVENSPRFLLGHMNHRLVFNRAYDAVTQLKPGRLMVTEPRSSRIRVNTMQKIESSQNLVRSVARVNARNLKHYLTPYDQWLQFKLPTILFDAVVEPVCVLLELPYRGLLQNPGARRMMQSLLAEISHVLENLPELQYSTVIRDYLHRNSTQKLLYNKILGKRSQPSQLLRRVEYGLPTDVEYLNGYFLRRSRQLGIKMPMNSMVRNTIKAKHSQAIERLNSFVAVEETSIPSDLSFRYRTSP